MEENNHISEEEFITRVESAARKGAKAGSRKGGLFSGLINLAIMVVIAFLLVNHFSFRNPFEREAALENHDLTIGNYGILGYTAADFAEAVLGNQNRKKELVVYEAEVSDVATITNAGLLKLKVFSKCQILTYHGTATYVVDLSDLTEKDFSVDEESRTVTVSIPHAQRREINVPREKIEFGDTEKGLLAFGKVKLSAEEQSKVESEAIKKMEARLDTENAGETADRFAELSVWEVYQPLITSVSPEYKLEIAFK